MKLTRRKLIWFEQMQDEIEKRMTHITDYIYRAKMPSNRGEEISSIDVGNERFRGMTTSKKWLRGEYSHTTYPTACLYSDEALARYREEKEQGELRRIKQQTEAEKETERRHLQRIRKKHPEFFNFLG